MLNKLDDFPIHQTPEPIAHVATSDRNAYDRTWFNGFARDGTRYFGIGMAVYPLRGILDCAFSVVEQGGRQHAFYASRRAPLERTDMQVGPLRLEVVEPLRRAVSCSTTTPAACPATSPSRPVRHPSKRAARRCGGEPEGLWTAPASISSGAGQGPSATPTASSR